MTPSLSICFIIVIIIVVIVIVVIVIVVIVMIIMIIIFVITIIVIIGISISRLNPKTLWCLFNVCSPRINRFFPSKCSQADAPKHKCIKAPPPPPGLSWVFLLFLSLYFSHFIFNYFL